MNVQKLLEEARRYGLGHSTARLDSSPQYGRRNGSNDGMWCKRCGGELKDLDGGNDRLVCTQCGLVSDQLVLATFDSTNLPTGNGVPSKKESKTSIAKGGKSKITYGVQNRGVRRNQDIYRLVRDAYRKAGCMEEVPEPVVELIGRISEARDYAPRKSPDSFSVGHVEEGHEGIEFEVALSKGKAPKKVWKAMTAAKIPNKLAGLSITELVGVIKYLLGSSIESIDMFFGSTYNDRSKNPFTVIQKVMKKPGVDTVLYPLFRERKERALQRLSSYYPDVLNWSREDERWVRQRINAIVDTGIVSPELSVRGSFVLYDMFRTPKCSDLAMCLKRFNMTKRQWEGFVDAITRTKFSRDLKSIV